MKAARRTFSVGGRYQVSHEIAVGGMATVHLATDLRSADIPRLVAVKHLHPHRAGQPELVRAFQDEARVSKLVRHTNVAEVIDVISERGELYLVMHFVWGETLDSLVAIAAERGEPIPPAIVSAIIVQLLHGLHAAHEATTETGEPLQLIHRDVSPQNVLVDLEGVARLFDFGIAIASGRQEITRDDRVKGKLSYMAPEQLMLRGATRAVDIYAAAVVAWEMLAGRRLFRGEDDAQTFGLVIAGKIPLPSTLVPSLSPAVDKVLLRALSADPAARPGTAWDFALELESAQSPARPADVASWVNRLAGDRIRARRHPSFAAEQRRGMESLVVVEPADGFSDAPGTLIGMGPYTPKTAPAEPDPDAWRGGTVRIYRARSPEPPSDEAITTVHRRSARMPVAEAKVVPRIPDVSTVLMEDAPAGVGGSVGTDPTARLPRRVRRWSLVASITGFCVLLAILAFVTRHSWSSSSDAQRRRTSPTPPEASP
jgi:eukaryotic-like serine/threonine-protein kinase